uniref:SKP1-like protein n=1 Tax=Caenorhabditis tropicalis TaxID=1561998 RepID=A0A1I7U5M9_9PELO
MTPTYTITLKFENSSEMQVICDKQQIDMIPAFRKAIEAQNSKWMNESTTLADPFKIPFKEDAVNFLITHVTDYIPPQGMFGDITPDHYKEARAKSLDELVHIMELANFLGCDGFLNCIGLCVARKLDEKSIDEVAQILGN